MLTLKIRETALNACDNLSANDPFTRGGTTEKVWVSKEQQNIYHNQIERLQVNKVTGLALNDGGNEYQYKMHRH